MEAIKRLWTIWKLTWPTTGESKVVAKPYYMNSIQHEYQRILATVEAYNEKDALKEWKEEIYV